ncbi:MAG: PilZ domain-containing protein [Elusimicrobiota bacterium]
MSGPEDRREAPRIFSDFSLQLTDEAGTGLDDRALAHDVSDKGFKAETQAELKPQQIVRFRVTIRGEEISGRARIAWAKRTDMSFWAGAEFLGMSWSDRRRVRRITSPSDVDWVKIGDNALSALVILGCTALAWAVMSSTTWRTVLSEIFPKAIAAVVMGLALREMFRPRR